MKFTEIHEKAIINTKVDYANGNVSSLRIYFSDGTWTDIGLTNPPGKYLHISFSKPVDVDTPFGPIDKI